MKTLRRLLPFSALAAAAMTLSSCTTYPGLYDYGTACTSPTYCPPVSQVYVAPRTYCAPTYYAPSYCAPRYYAPSCYAGSYYSGSIGIGYSGYAHGYGGGYGHGGYGYGHGGHHCD